MPDPLYFFVHLPKTAGQSVVAHLHGRMRDFDKVAARYSMVDAEQPDYVDGLLARGSDLRVVHGHRVSRALIERFPDRDTRPVVVLREPVQYLVSLFNYDHREAGLTPDSPETLARFDSWVTEHTDRQARWLVAVYGDKGFPYAFALPEDTLRTETIALLRTFWCIGNVVNLSATLKPFFHILGLPATMEGRRNVSGKAYARLVEITPDLRKRVLALNPVDNEIYWNFATRQGARA